MTASDFDHACGFLLTRGRSPYIRRYSGAISPCDIQPLPSDTNFFMVHLRRDVAPVIEAFRAKGVLVGHP
jgi:hypothetical protein